MDIDEATAAALGWPKAKYAWVERERRWLCHAIPWQRVLRSESITDLYVTDTQLRLREAIPSDGGPASVARPFRVTGVTRRAKCAGDLRECDPAGRVSCSGAEPGGVLRLMFKPGEFLSREPAMEIR